ncbi:hypothetical protein LOTGIDRAFT_141239 [Lottia gigantea]|uniref:Kazal-like domain-containing protein n=1 Tax=Lottia gigantea TaxID=225164 RepID=V4AYJ1_LOTGI|nr:hypothetical protein LOTGIDRAFT_141239 [Lottia gigantea]ESP00166.1 hypothetical protein LOTGIDRAFT_141239 [Lottia gigantea]
MLIITYTNIKQLCYGTYIFQATSDVSLSRYCDTSVENLLFSCLHRQKGGEKCCSHAETFSCSLVCQSYHTYNSTNKREEKDILFKHCHGNNEKVYRCVQRQSRSTRASNPADKIPCCDRDTTPQCRDRCRDILKTSTGDDSSIIEDVIAACGQPDVRLPLWQCFLKTPAAKRNETPLVTGLDSAKLQCCSKAKTSRCRDLCTWTYNSDFVQHSKEFYQSCSYIQPVSMLEASMHNCLTDVEEPCQLGCKGLDFCSNFNYRPTQLFRSCNSQADKAARDAVKAWEKGTISLPQMTIPVRDIRQCKPEVWKAIACALQIKPCLKKPSPLSLCMEDCIYILSECVDKNRLSGHKTVPQLCNALPSKQEDGACISLSQYLSNNDIGKDNEVTSPCHPNPCGKREVCQVRRRKCKHLEDCKPYICKEGCMLGQMSTFLVPRGVYVRIPDKVHGTQPNEQCYKACHCSHRNKIENCKQLPCFTDKHCVIGPKHRKGGGTHFTIDKTLCACHDGHMICSKNNCKSPMVGATTSIISDMPGNCPAHYKPVCAKNGKTYPNFCLAKCAGFDENDVVQGSCSSQDPCSNEACGAGQRCVARRQVCLSYIDNNCNQFECVSESMTCNPHYHDSVCDDTGEEFTNACILFSHERTLAYRGHCMSGCSNTGEVCGHNGETYPSQCAAMADRTTVDYLGECRALGNLTGRSHCSNVKCQPLKPKHCKGLIPPGGCCPVCAAELHALFDPSQVESATRVMNEGPLTVTTVLNELSNQLTIAECDIFGYLSSEGGLVILVSTIVDQPTNLQLEACNSEAQRLEHLIRTGSPLLQSYLTLTPLLVAPVRKVTIDPSHSINESPSLNPSVLILLTTFLVLIFKQRVS